ncbi:MAG TPA: leucyl/phenylalanyl-tRNA--protein transferase [Candidatus Hydrogenedentes bacterium]|nr:leucyl/phenylalanyl-tRNA--protein transferase [Candidatus Hydrogenedentota bacterium]
MPIFRLTREFVFPPPHLADEDGLLAVGGDLRPERLLAAYQAGIFPWYSDGQPILWWSPDPRMVLFPDEFHCSRSLWKTLKRGAFEVRFDTAFKKVIAACAAAPRSYGEGTWITGAMKRAYTRLHELGYAHSVECWQEGSLAGGLYGLSLGTCFFGESMFTQVTDASKAALSALVELCRAWDFEFIDCQVPNGHLLRLGAREIPRPEFLERLGRNLEQPTRQGSWRCVAVRTRADRDKE